MTPLPFPPRCKPSRWRRAWQDWLDLPALVRPALLIVVVLIVLALAGCSHFNHFRGDIDILTEDVNACSINPHPHPGCVIGMMVYGKWHYF